MNYKQFAIFLMFFLWAQSLSAQKIKPRFSTVNSVGALIGVSNPEVLFQSVNGIKFNEWFIGAGIGIDKYAIVSMPLFLDLRMDFGDQKKAFLYGDLGHNFFLKDKRTPEFSVLNEESYAGGIYTDIGVGMRTTFIKNIKMAFSMGFSNKKIRQTTVYQFCNPFNPCYENTSQYRYNYGRFNLKIGLMLE